MQNTILISKKPGNFASSFNRMKLVYAPAIFFNLMPLKELCSHFPFKFILPSATQGCSSAYQFENIKERF